eukprot:5064206-Pleurochrysis_carterae.AAC.3
MRGRAWYSAIPCASHWQLGAAIGASGTIPRIPLTKSSPWACDGGAPRPYPPEPLASAGCGSGGRRARAGACARVWPGAYKGVQADGTICLYACGCASACSTARASGDGATADATPCAITAAGAATL